MRLAADDHHSAYGREHTRGGQQAPARVRSALREELNGEASCRFSSRMSGAFDIGIPGCLAQVSNRPSGW
eukprot:8136582-Pyramimonas_sp.AAC.1